MRLGKLSTLLRDEHRLIGSSMLITFVCGFIKFGLAVWLYLRTESIAAFAMFSILAMAPGILLAPLIGSWLDRADRIKALRGVAVGLLVASLLLLASLSNDLAVLPLALAIVICISIAEAVESPAAGEPVRISRLSCVTSSNVDNSNR